MIGKGSSWMALGLALGLAVGACAGESAPTTTITLDVETFEELDPLILDSETVAAIVAGRQPSPEYSSNPPTSGARAAQWAQCGIYRQEIPGVFQVASLARGTVIVQYQARLTADERESIEQIVRGLGDGVIVAPRFDLPAPVVLTSWGTMLMLNGVDSARMVAFAAQYSGGGPSTTDCVASVDEAA